MKATTKYESPEIDVICLGESDIIITSMGNGDTTIEEESW